jgi:dTDP-4-dehydrorhamnose 3,5-epimerase
MARSIWQEHSEEDRIAYAEKIDVEGLHVALGHSLIKGRRGTVIFTEVGLPGAYTIDLELYEDERGFFTRAWCRSEFAEHGLVTHIAQANLAYTRRAGTLRGMHYQIAPHSEAKVVRCIRGAIFDVMIDLRRESPTYKRWIGVQLSDQNRKMVYVPEGFAHGYQCLQDDTETFYFVTALYTSDAERGVRWDDPAFGIEWPIVEAVEISEKDRNWPDFVG